MKPHWLIVTILSVGYSFFGWSQTAPAQWPVPPSSPSSCSAAPGGIAGGFRSGGQGNCGARGYAMGGYGMPCGGGNACGSGGCGLNYSDFADDGYGSSCVGRGGPRMGGLAAGCRPVGMLGKLGTFTGLGPGCGHKGYHPGAFSPGVGLANPYDQYPGFGAANEFLNYGDVCCGPHWYDIMVQAVFIQRQGDTNVGLTSEGPRGAGQPNIVLSTDDLDLDLNTAIRVAGRLQTSAATSIEAVYLGGLDWDDAQRVVSNSNDLYSVYSNFGDDPLGGFEDTDQAAEQTAALNSDFDSVEVNFRKGWMLRNQKTSGSWLIGARYMRLRDDFQYNTTVLLHDDPIFTGGPFGPGASQTNVRTENDILGVQIGADLVQCILPGFLIGGEAKAGAYGNSASQDSQFAATQLAGPLIEGASKTEFSYGADAQAFVLWQFHPLLKARGGYEIIYLGNVATGYGNFNAQSPFGLRNAVLNDTDELILHGFHVALEFGW